MASQVRVSSDFETEINPLNRILARAYTLDWYTLAMFTILALAIFTRFFELGVRVMSHDESLHTKFSFDLYRDGNFRHTPLMHGPILFHATAFFFWLFGDNDFTARLYPAIFGVGMVMFPFLMQRWIGRIGALLVSIMLLISPLTLYYNRYIRHDTPAIFFSLVMIYSIFMYLNGPDAQRRRAHWLYIFAAAMLGNLGSKETAFIYIAIFGSFLTLYWVVRVVQHYTQSPGKTIFYFSAVSILVGGLAALAMYVVLSIVPFSGFRVALSEAGFNALEVQSFVLWTLLIIIFLALVVLGSAFYAFRRAAARFRWSDVVVIFLVAAIVAVGLIVVEERSRSISDPNETAAPAVPGEAVEQTGISYDTLPLSLTWVAAALVIGAAVVTYNRGWWRHLRPFPEFDILILMGVLILPWLAPFIVAATGAQPTDYSSGSLRLAREAISQGHLPEAIDFLANAIQTDGIARSLMAVVPLFMISITFGVLWNWKRFAISAAIFYALFAFFFTTMFTNGEGVASGLVGSLGYWIEQQGVRRGSQPQYYYLLVIMPFYEFLPVIGSALAMISGFSIFWKFRQKRLEALGETKPVTIDESVSVEADAAEAYLDVIDAVDDEPDEVPTVERIVGEDAVRDGDVVMPMVRRRWAGDYLDRVPFMLFVAWWAILNLIAYTLAGEKMPWLGIHMTLPLIIMSGWYFGRVIERIDFRLFMQRGWLYLLLLPLLFIAIFRVTSPIFLQPGIFGLRQEDLANTGGFFAAVLITGLILFGLYQIVQQTGWRHLRHMTAVSVFVFLAFLTFRSAWMAAFINPDLATEYLVYAHAAPAIKTVLNEIEELSLRTTDGLELSFAYDNESSWPYSWYFRNFTNATFVGGNPTIQNLDGKVAVVVGEGNRSRVEPILEDRYFHFEHIRLWWPMQDYFGLTPQRINDALALDAEGARFRRGLFDIWWARDYDAYGQAVGRNFDITQWPVSDRMHFYVRKDIAAQIWSLGVGDGTVLAEQPDVTEVSACVANWQPLSANLVFGAPGTGSGFFNRPLDLALLDNGNILVAEEFNNRLSLFDNNGVFVSHLLPGVPDELNPIFTRPNGVAVGPDGNVYVADTWNYRVQVFSPDGEFITAWGEPGQYGFEAEREPIYGFWGPRDVVVDDSGRVFVSDTGNKRVRVYDTTGAFLYDIASGGSNPGELNEPAGLAIHPDGRLFVADTWNRRVSVFDLDGQFLETFPVRAWFDEQGNRPYLAIDPARDLLYVTDPDAARVLVYNTAGECIGSFGELNRENPGATQFNIIGGITVDDAGQVYVSDAGSGRVLRFDPFPAPQQSFDAPDEQSDAAVADDAVDEADAASDDASNVSQSEPDDEQQPDAELANPPDDASQSDDADVADEGNSGLSWPGNDAAQDD
ncbi:MAG: TIGR03663 family protein [Chloroflexi bacterium]|nr:MAG: hypothetical protein CUN54_01050 [Phototrophicales bacterium]RMF78136.1 MAG: TIGR03663 family protein [Chloroflexota bacterium]